MRNSSKREHDAWVLGNLKEMAESLTAWLNPEREQDRFKVVKFTDPSWFALYLESPDTPNRPASDTNGNCSLHELGRYRTLLMAEARIRLAARELDRRFEYWKGSRTDADPDARIRLRWRELIPVFYVVRYAERFHVLYSWTER